VNIPQLSLPDFDKSVLPLFWMRDLSNVTCIGTLFIISSTNRAAVALTARHTLDYLRQQCGLDDLSEAHVPAPFRKRRGLSVTTAGNGNTEGVNLPLINMGTLFTCIPPDKLIELVGGHHLLHHAVDVSVMGLVTKTADEDFENRFALQSKGPRLGETVRLIGYNWQSGLSVDQIAQDETSIRFSIRNRSIDAEVVSIHRWGEDRLVKGPCFRVNKPVDSGFSGGPAIVMRENGDAAVCGMISASDEDETIVSLIYPSLCLPLPFPVPPGRKPQSLLTLIERGGILDYSEAHKKLRFREEDEHGDPNHFAVWLDG
jgi:hypothetical protein